MTRSGKIVDRREYGRDVIEWKGILPEAECAYMGGI
jgi:hypothetical protein